MPSAATADHKLIAGSATPQGTLRYAARFRGKSAAGHFREAPSGLVLSSIGIGTYLGEPDEATDEAYSGAVVAAVEGGFNVVDTAINYRFQRSERSIGAALQELISNGFSRDEIVLCTKAGFLTPDGEMPADAKRIFFAGVRRKGSFRRGGYRGGMPLHDSALSGGPIGAQPAEPGRAVRGRLLPAQPGNATRRDIERRVPAADSRSVSSFWNPRWRRGKSAPTGWPPGTRSAKTRNRPAIFRSKRSRGSQREVGGSDHHFRFVQLPLNLAMPEALTRPNQMAVGKTMAMVQAGRALGITLVASAALLQGQLTKNLARDHAQRVGNEERFRAGAAICAIRAGNHDGAGGDEPDRARGRIIWRLPASNPRQEKNSSRFSRRDAKSRCRSTGWLGCQLINPRVDCGATSWKLSRKKMIHALERPPGASARAAWRKILQHWRANRIRRFHPG